MNKMKIFNSIMIVAVLALFSGKVVAAQEIELSGIVSGDIQGGVTITLSGNADEATETTADDGTYSFTEVGNGSYTITPSLEGYSFTPANTTVTIDGDDVTGVDFVSVADEQDDDIDDDGVLNEDDKCEDTPVDETVDPSNGCSIEQLVPCVGPREITGPWRNHGQYVSAFTKTVNSFIKQKLIAKDEKRALMKIAASSDCGKYVPWPTSGWQSTYPEKQGMDSGSLADMLEFIKEQDSPIHSVLVVRNGYLVTEAYFQPFQEEFFHGLASCSKSILSALVGIAIDEGYIENEEQKVLDFFPEYNPADVDPWKESITLRHLLMMSAAWDARDNFAYGWEGLYKMMASSDWAEYVLDLPMADPPGEFFEYKNCDSYLLAAILDKATQKNGLDFANEKLFSPLGIPASQVKWPINSQGVILVLQGITLRPIDMAKFGFLYLHKGLWDGKQIISKEWVDASTKKQILTPGSMVTLTPEYGFQWWVTQKGYFVALGFAGQYIIVNPSENLVVVFTSALEAQTTFLPKYFYEIYILGAILSDEALSDNVEQQARLDDIIKQVSTPPAPEPVPLLPDIANAISGKTFYFETNPYGFKTFSLTFTPGADEALYSLNRENDSHRGDTEIQDAPIGLDNVYRYYLDKDNFLIAHKGQWENETTFVMNVKGFERPPQGLISRLTFEGSRVTIKDSATTHDESWETTAEIQ